MLALAALICLPLHRDLWFWAQSPSPSGSAAVTRTRDTGLHALRRWGPRGPTRGGRSSGPDTGLELTSTGPQRGQSLPTPCHQAHEEPGLTRRWLVA